MNDPHIYIYEGHSINKGKFLNKTIFFLMIIFDKYKFWIVWNWFIAQIILTLQKYLFWGYSKRQLKQTAPELKQRSVMKFLAAEKYKHDEFCRRMCVVYKEAYFRQKMFTKRLYVDKQKREINLIVGKCKEIKKHKVLRE